MKPSGFCIIVHQMNEYEKYFINFRSTQFGLILFISYVCIDY